MKPFYGFNSTFSSNMDVIKETIGRNHNLYAKSLQNIRSGGISAQKWHEILQWAQTDNKTGTFHVVSMSLSTYLSLPLSLIFLCLYLSLCTYLCLCPCLCLSLCLFCRCLRLYFCLVRLHYYQVLTSLTAVTGKIGFQHSTGQIGIKLPSLEEKLESKR